MSKETLSKDQINEGADIRKDSVRQARDTPCDVLSTEWRCACPHPDEHECYRLRYPAPMDDLARADYFAQIADLGLQCECVCHQEYGDENDE